MRWDEDDSSKDRLLRDYDTILKESAVLTTFAGVLFGFLLNISIRNTNQLIYPEKIVIVLALFSITIAVSFFVMPVIFIICNFLIIAATPTKEKEEKS